MHILNIENVIYKMSVTDLKEFMYKSYCKRIVVLLKKIAIIF